MSVHEIQCGSLVHFALYGDHTIPYHTIPYHTMVNSGYEKSGHHSIFDLGGFETGQFPKSIAKCFKIC